MISKSKIAMEEFTVEIIHRETIKPSKPTPLGLRNLKLSLLDQLAPMIYVPYVFCYLNDAKAPPAADQTYFGRSQRLKTSLSETLTRFYPFAGRISSRSTIECNDEGVDYVETRVNSLLQDILKQPVLESLNKLTPTQVESTEAEKGGIFFVKVNFFQCGGMAIGVSISHKIADVSTLNLFIKSWAATARGSCEVVLPDFKTVSSLFPSIDLPFQDFVMDLKQQKLVMRRLLFDASKISILKAQAASGDVPEPTRVEAVTALIWKCAMAAATSNRGKLKKPSGLLQAVNLRPRMNPPLPDYSMGNLVSGFIACSSESVTELSGLVKQLRSGSRGFRETFIRKLRGSNAASAIFDSGKQVENLSKRNDVDFYISTSLCGAELYGADFGWGKPTWVSFGSFIPLNYYMMMDSRDGGGIQAWVTLTEAEMAVFERNPQLLAFASVYPFAKL